MSFIRIILLSVPLLLIIGCSSTKKSRMESPKQQLNRIEANAKQALKANTLGGYETFLKKNPKVASSLTASILFKNTIKKLKSNILTANSGWLPTRDNNCKVYNHYPSKTQQEEVIWSGSCDSKGIVNGFGEATWLADGKAIAKYRGVHVNGSINGVAEKFIYKNNEWVFTRLMFFNHGKESSQYIKVKDKNCLIMLPQYAHSKNYVVESAMNCQAGLLHGSGRVKVSELSKDNKAEFLRSFYGKVQFGKLQGAIRTTGYTNSCIYNYCYRVEADYGYVNNYYNGIKGKELSRFGQKCFIYKPMSTVCAQYEDFDTGELITDGGLTLGDVYQGLKRTGEVVGAAYHASKPVINTAVCGNADGCELSKVYEQGDNVTSNVEANSGSTGNIVSVCFLFNNTLEFDINAQIEITKVDDHSLRANSGGLLGSNCIDGDSLGGEYQFIYKTDNRQRSGSFYISGNYSTIQVELSTNFLKGGPFEVFINEQ